MRKSSFEISFRDYRYNMIFDSNFLMKIEKAKKVIKSVDEKQDVFEAYVFPICANWEILVETLLIDCFNKDTSRYREYTGFKIPKNLTRETCQAIILGIGYVDFKSISHLKQTARNILVPRFNPFKEIPIPNADKIDEFFSIRNYLAHYSDLAMRSLTKIYKNKYGLKTVRKPGEFLLAKDTVEKIPRMGVYISNFEDTAVIMAKFLNVAIDIQ